MADSTDNSDALKCMVVTPEATVLNTTADFVALPLFDGEIGIAKHHSPMIGRVGYGELRIKNAEAVDRYYVDGGFVQVADNQVAVLTSRAVPAAEVDRKTAEDQLREESGRTAAGPEEIAIRERRVLQARGQLRVAAHNS